MSRCKTCRFWNSGHKGQDFQIHANGVGSWPYVKSENRECLRVEDAMFQTEVRLAMVYGPDHAGLYTAPDFGCVQHETKEIA